jgi:uncharacterized protein YuzE
MEALKILEKQSNLDWEYDAEADVLYISVGEPRNAEGMDIGEGIIARVEPQTMEVVGLTIIGLRQRMLNALEK